MCASAVALAKPLARAFCAAGLQTVGHLAAKSRFLHGLVCDPRGSAGASDIATPRGPTGALSFDAEQVLLKVDPQLLLFYSLLFLPFLSFFLFLSFSTLLK